ncbi:DeoR/GlpR family DNA-binding transcription regulator [Aureimonas altamirensis]|uniref:DeoR/GlpR family DNA-binding transcription regulator n=1 Tax=Aureimonas altamirensis TaxID=370622 RepID=UPI002036DBF2|nr:DeoR/GlpR family DNA-binding transcription regulator [Aureimonas altamirensis]MCM2502925.1 DeoR/GlpR family DNA-binding transcription regulator [Aureimonas altamirensis]
MQQRFPHERQQRMAGLIAERGSLTVAQLAHHFAASEPTIRRDLALLEQAGLAARTHGGVVAPRTGEAMEPLFLEKLRVQQGAKKRIGKAAAAHVSGHRSILLDSGTTMLALAQELAGRAISIVALDLKVAEAAAVGATQAHVPAGQVRNGYFSIVGAPAIEAISGFTFDLFFMAADAIDLEGVSNSTRDEADVKLAAISRARRTILLADHTKLDSRALVPVCPLDSISLLIADTGATRRIAPYRELIEKIELC